MEIDPVLSAIAREAYDAALERNPFNRSDARGKAVAAVAAASGWDSSTALQFVQRALSVG